jgi:hypothetical protein
MSPTNYNSCKSTKRGYPEFSSLKNIVNITTDLKCNIEQSNPINKTFNATINWKESQIVVYYPYRRVIYDKGLNFN